MSTDWIVLPAAGRCFVFLIMELQIAVARRRAAPMGEDDLQLNDTFAHHESSFVGDGSWPEARGVIEPLAVIADVGRGEGGREDMCVNGRADGKTNVDIDTFLPRVWAGKSEDEFGSGDKGGRKTEGGEKMKIKHAHKHAPIYTRCPQEGAHTA